MRWDVKDEEKTVTADSEHDSETYSEFEGFTTKDLPREVISDPIKVCT